MGVFGRSWRLTKLSFGVIKQDKEMLLFPLLAGIFSLLYAIGLLYPTIIVVVLREGGAISSAAFDVLDYMIVFTTYLGLAFIATFFNVCVVFTTKTRFEGGDATFMDSIKFALSKIHLVFVWSLISATVGILMYALDNIAERAGAVGKIILAIVRGIVGALWSIVTIFVIPAMVYDGLGPIDAIKRSVQTLKQTWGESLVRHYGLGFAQFLFFLLGVLLAVGLFMGLAPLGSVGLVIAIAVSVTYFLGVILVFSVANGVFNTALYAYANGRAPAAFDETTLAGAFIAKD
jgi:hypothetical protein